MHAQWWMCHETHYPRNWYKLFCVALIELNTHLRMHICKELIVQNNLNLLIHQRKGLPMYVVINSR
jgi:hypothetical protein